MPVYEEDYKRNCAYCEDEFLAKRINQIYCCHRCKYTCNNRKRDLRSRQMSSVNAFLVQNFKLAKGLWDQHKEKALFSKEQLIRMGFNFKYFTHYIQLEGGKTATGIYNFCMLPQNDNYKIINTADHHEL